MKIPSHLKHKPIIQVENYESIDGIYKNKTDAKGLSIGIAQWNNPGFTDISAKVWRNTGQQWSRQSEELPLHRVIDLATLICTTIKYIKTGDLSSEEDFQLSLSDNPDLHHHIEIMKKELEKNDLDLVKSLKRLSSKLKEIGY